MFKQRESDPSSGEVQDSEGRYLSEWMQKMTFGRFFFSYRSIVSKMKFFGNPTRADWVKLRKRMMLSECRHWSLGC